MSQILCNCKGSYESYFSKKNLVIRIIIEEAIEKVDYVITGTSWQSQIEKETLLYAKIW